MGNQTPAIGSNRSCWMPPYCYYPFQAILTVWIHQDPTNVFFFFFSYSGAFWATSGHFLVLQGQFWGHSTPATGSNRSGWMPSYCLNFFPGNFNYLDPSGPTKLLFEPFWGFLGHFLPFLGALGSILGAPSLSHGFKQVRLNAPMMF